MFVCFFIWELCVFSYHFCSPFFLLPSYKPPPFLRLIRGNLFLSVLPVGLLSPFPCCLRLASLRMSMMSVANSRALKRASFWRPWGRIKSKLIVTDIHTLPQPPDLHSNLHTSVCRPRFRVTPVVSYHVSWKNPVIQDTGLPEKQLCAKAHKPCNYVELAGICRRQKKRTV